MRRSFSHSYQLLASYFAEVKLVDPDLVFDIQTTSCKYMRFIRCFWCFGAPKKIYQLLRPVVVIDGTFLKWRYKYYQKKLIFRDGIGRQFVTGIVYYNLETVFAVNKTKIAVANTIIYLIIIL
ncbi:hypothetical protein GIB67_018318 [Kingdonia uniflora]|uniref:Uncharacterized protein n=1 Tax=Kingdonia uniflora TaxID=39325 RepID=A0A7J7MJ47_9MAGN|nr:hypothetical protein GIB67_018318 [Kingdonia uniflora]